MNLLGQVKVAIGMGVQRTEEKQQDEAGRKRILEEFEQSPEGIALTELLANSRAKIILYKETNLYSWKTSEVACQTDSDKKLVFTRGYGYLHFGDRKVNMEEALEKVECTVTRLVTILRGKIPRLCEKTSQGEQYFEV